MPFPPVLRVPRAKVAAHCPSCPKSLMNPARSGTCESRVVQPVLRREQTLFRPNWNFDTRDRRGMIDHFVRFAADLLLLSPRVDEIGVAFASTLVMRIRPVARFAMIQFRPLAARSIHTPLNKRSGESPRT